MLQKLDYKKVRHALYIEGIFRDGKDSMYFITGDEVWHVTFKKVDGKIEEWIREIMILDGLDHFFLSDVEFRYTSNYQTMGGVRKFLKKKPAFEDYKDIINEFVLSRQYRSRFNARKRFEDDDWEDFDKYDYDDDFDAPF